MKRDYVDEMMDHDDYEDSVSPPDNLTSKAVDNQTWRSTFKWYFSPYLSTIITAPMFLVLLLAFLSAVIFSIYYYILIIIGHPIVLILLPGLPLWGLHATAINYACFGIPSVWNSKTRNVVLRILFVSFIFVGSIVFWNFWEALQAIVTSWLVGRSLF